MAYEILQTVGTWTSNIDSAARNRHYSRHTNGIMQGILNECPFANSGQNGVVLGTGWILIEGLELRVYAPESFSFSSFPTQSELWHLVAQAEVGEIMDTAGDRSRKVTASIFPQKKTTLIQQDLFKNQTGIYQLEIGTFNMNPNNTISNIYREVDVILPEVGPTGPQGEMPNHYWQGTKLSFERPDGTFEDFVDLKGSEGSKGPPGPIGPRGLEGQSIYSTYVSPIYLGDGEYELKIEDINIVQNRSLQVFDLIFSAPEYYLYRIDEIRGAAVILHALQYLRGPQGPQGPAGDTTAAEAAATNSANSASTAQTAATNSANSAANSEVAALAAQAAAEEAAAKGGTVVTVGGVAQATFNADIKAPLASPAFTDTPTAPTASVGTSTTQLATTAFVNSEIANDRPYSNANPLMNGTASQGTSANISRQDHVHPSDTAKLTIPTGTTAQVLNGKGTPITPTATPTNASTLPFTAGGAYTELAKLVTLSTAQTISGVKTFTANIIANSLTVTPANLGYLNGVTSNIQSQINEKLYVVASRLTSTGFMRFSNGLTIQWGTITSTATGAGLTWSFPTNFTNSTDYQVIATPPYGQWYFIGTSANSPTKFNYRAYSGGGSNQSANGASWFAIGY